MTKLRAWISVSLASAALSLTACSGGGGGGSSSPAAPSKLSYAHNPAILPVGLSVVPDTCISWM